MPKPHPKESKNDYMNRCIPKLIEEGKESNQAVAICNSMYEQHTKDKTYTDLSRYIENK